MVATAQGLYHDFFQGVLSAGTCLLFVRGTLFPYFGWRTFSAFIKQSVCIFVQCPDYCGDSGDLPFV